MFSAIDIRKTYRPRGGVPVEALRGVTLRFGERGIPLRAWLDCVFQEYIPPKKAGLARPLESPDTTKYRTVRQGDSLWALAAREYGQPEQWRAIADANGLANPRLLRSGARLVLPALKQER